MNLPSPENPITITLKVTSVNQLLNLWHRLKMAENEIEQRAIDRLYSYRWDRANESSPSFPWWAEVNGLIKHLNLEDQL